MTLLVDFNMVREDGRIPALVTPDQIGRLTPGTRVIAADGEGTECDAIVDEVATDRSLAMLRPVEGTTRPSDVKPPASDPLAR